MKEELLYFLFEFTKRGQAFDVCYKNITADDNAYSGQILVYNEGKNMIISYSSFTRATLLSVLTLDAQVVFTKVNYYTTQMLKK